jgi:hypothetical protein
MNKFFIIFTFILIASSGCKAEQEEKSDKNKCINDMTNFISSIKSIPFKEKNLIYYFENDRNQRKIDLQIFHPETENEKKLAFGYYVIDFKTSNFSNITYDPVEPIFIEVDRAKLNSLEKQCQGISWPRWRE